MSTGDPQAPGYVLVVEDDEALRESVCELLTESGHEAMSVPHRVAALAHLRASTRRPAVILLDLMMPVMSGWQFREAQLRDPSLAAIPVVVMSATRDLKGIQTDEVLFKPMKLARLLEVVARFRGAPPPAPRAAARAALVDGVWMQAPIPICVLRGQHLVYEFANRLYCQIAGKQDLVGRSLSDAIPELRGQGFDQLLLGVMRTGEPFIGKEMLLRLDRDGDGVLEDAYFTFVYSPIREPDGTIDRVMAVVNDVTEQVLARHAAEHSQSSRLEAMQQALHFSELFVGVLGHDLRNPLSAISAAAQLLDARAETERVHAPVGRIVRSAARMERMISQLLDLTRIRFGGGLPLTRAPVDLGELSRAIIDELQPVHRRDVRLELVGDPRAIGDADLLSQLLSNVVGNACQHGAADAPVLVRVDGRSAENVVVDVRNEGAIPAPLLPFLFDPLRQPKSRGGDRTGPSGLGLGLFISQQICHAHGGNIRAESDLGATRFSFDLPRQTRGPAPTLTFDGAPR